MKKTTIKLLLLLTVATFCLASCDDNGEYDPRVSRLYIGMASVNEYYLDTLLATRALPAGYTPYDTKAQVADGTKIFLYLPTSTSASDPMTGTFGYYYEAKDSAGGWVSDDVEVVQNAHYGIFGYMPESAIASSSITCASGYDPASNSSVTLTLNGIDAICAEDVCVVVGHGDEVGTANDSPALGDHHYTGKAGTTDDKNQVYLLMDHLFSQIDFRFKISNVYYLLRTVRIKSITLSATGTSTVDATVPQTPNNSGVSSLGTVTWTTHSGSVTTSIYPRVADETLLLTNNFQSVPGYFFPSGSRTPFSMTVNYDVLDRWGRVIRENQTATNTWTASNSFTFERGKKYTVNVTVNPTYLYQLSDYDRDNPSFSFN